MIERYDGVMYRAMPWIVGGLLLLAAAILRRREQAATHRSRRLSSYLAWIAVAIMANESIQPAPHP